MRIAFVGHGNLPIPPVGWGAVERVIFEYAEGFRGLGADVEIVNVKAEQAAQHVWRLHRTKPLDWVWCHNERAIALLDLLSKVCRFRLVATGHMPFDPSVEPSKMVSKFFRRLGRSRYHLALSQNQADRISSRGLIAIQPNGVDVEQVAFSPNGNGRAICLGKIEPRKRQAELAEICEREGIPCDFVGPSNEPFMVSEPCRYLGAWSSDQVRENLTEYSVLALVSQAEAFPLVVLEGLAAGLSMVVSPAAAAAFDGSEPFLRVVPSVSHFPEAYLGLVAVGDTQRDQARTFAKAHFDLDMLAKRAYDQLSAWSSER